MFVVLGLQEAIPLPLVLHIVVPAHRVTLFHQSALLHQLINLRYPSSHRSLAATHFRHWRLLLKHSRLIEVVIILFIHLLSHWPFQSGVLLHNGSFGTLRSHLFIGVTMLG